jgi:prepilin-type N-terminal cleavage/methylation domain-containing protein
MMNKGLTLVEMLVSIAIFGILTVSLVGMFSSAMDAQASILQNQEMLNQASYAVEYMDRAIRMALRDDATNGASGACTGTLNDNYGISSNSIQFLTYDTVDSLYKCKRFYLESNVLKEQKSTNMTSASFQAGTEVTSSKVKFNSLVFNVVGDNYGSSQPIVTIIMDIQSNSSRRLNPIPSMVLQTSISQRNLNVSE